MKASKFTDAQKAFILKQGADGILDFSRPGKPTDNAFIEAFNGRLRAECLNAHWFLGLDDARGKLAAWRRDYNEQRPTSFDLMISAGGRTRSLPTSPFAFLPELRYILPSRIAFRNSV